MKKSGIYRIKNIITGDCYVGSSVNIEKRLRDHQRLFRLGLHNNAYMQNSYNKYGVDAFVYNVLDYCENILEREQMYIDTGAFKFNICKVAACPPSQKGKKRSAETLAKLSAAHKGIVYGPMSEEHKAKISAAQIGKIIPDEQKAKISATLKSRRHTS